MARVLTLAVVLCSCIQGMYGQGSIQDVIRERPELSQLNEFMRGTDIISALGMTSTSASKFTLFAPNIAAMQALLPTVIGSLSKEDKELLLNYHLVADPSATNSPPWSLNTMQNRRVESSARNAPKLFFRTYTVGQQKNYYVNGAQIIEGDIQAQNGIVHIIDSVLYPVAEKRNALALIEASKQESNLDLRAKIFYDLLYKVRFQVGSPFGSLNSDTTFVTIFVPSDRSLEKVLTAQRKEKLLQDNAALLKLLNRHVIVHSVSPGDPTDDGLAVWHAKLLDHAIEDSLLTGRPPAIAAKEGQIKPVRVGNTLFVTNMCGMVKVMDLPDPMPMAGDMAGRTNYQTTQTQYASQFPVRPDRTVNNGVVHFVDGLFGYIYTDAIGMLEEEEAISKFKDYVRMSSMIVDRLTVAGDTVIRDSDKLTIFAPINGAFVNLERADNIDLTQDAEQREKVLNMHMVQEVLNLVDITNDTRKKTLRTDEDVYAQFYTDRTGTYVEVDRVRARIVKADVCVKNGIIHYIDNLLGMPYRSIIDEIREEDMLNDLYETILKTPEFVEGNRNGLQTIKQILGNTMETRTFFAPNTHAFRSMRTSQIGRNYMEDRNQLKLYYLLLRHMPIVEFFIEDNIRGKLQVPESDGLSVYMDGDDYVVEYAGEHGTVQAKVVQRNIRLINGVMHIVDAVLFEDNQLAFESISGAPFLPASFLLLCVCFLSYLL